LIGISGSWSGGHKARKFSPEIPEVKGIVDATADTFSVVDKLPNKLNDEERLAYLF
jgi:hypothetical protein